MARIIQFPMSREQIKKLAKDPREEELILKGMQIAFDIAQEHEDAYGRVSQHEAADAISVFKMELTNAMFER